MRFTEALAIAMLAICQAFAAPNSLPASNNQKAFAKPSCGTNMKAYCVRGEFDFTEYNSKNPRCLDDGHNRVFCSSVSDLKQNILKHLPEGYVDSKGTVHHNTETTPHNCPNRMLYDDVTHQCTHRRNRLTLNRHSCPANLAWNSKTQKCDLKASSKYKTKTACLKHQSMTWDSQANVCRYATGGKYDDNKNHGCASGQVWADGKCAVRDNSPNGHKDHGCGVGERFDEGLQKCVCGSGFVKVDGACRN